MLEYVVCQPRVFCDKANRLECVSVFEKCVKMEQFESLGECLVVVMIQAFVNYKMIKPALILFKHYCDSNLSWSYVNLSVFMVTI